MNRRAFLAGLTATTAGLLVPEKKIWALDRTMVRGGIPSGLLVLPIPDWLNYVRDMDTPLLYMLERAEPPVAATMTWGWSARMVDA